jgi:glycosyltransferase involved in cell wall biosynthesis
MPNNSRQTMIIDKLKYRKSAGIPVGPKVYSVLQAANTARDLHQHARAASLFREALDHDPSLAHIWVQYGHMLRETGNAAEAEDAYHEALRLAPDADPHVHLGHLYKERGQIARAARSYLAAARANPDNHDALTELHQLMARNIEITPEDIMALTSYQDDVTPGEEDPVASAALRARSALDTFALTLRQEGSDDQSSLLEATRALIEKLEPCADFSDASHDGATKPTIIFDVSDLISYFNNARLPTGIQRVQIEAIRNALRDTDQIIKVCAFLDSRDEWVEITPAMFLLLCRLSLTSGDLQAPEWISTLNRLRLTMTMSDAMAFPRGAFLVNLGTSWWLQNYFLYVRQAKTAAGIRYVPFVHDLIPVMASEHCTKELTQDFITWAMGVFEHADHFFVNSEATKRDLLRVAGIMGHHIDDENIVVIRLDADFRKPIATPLAGAELSKWGINRSEFVLFVSTIESRKNHIGAFEAWINLIRDHGVQREPKLDCVGNRGWLNDMVYARLATHDVLRSRVIMLSGLSDAELDLIYRSCLFTLYPSNYEGWGLPVTESLCYGKVPLVSDASSLPEAGGSFAHFFEAGSTPRLTSALEQLIFDRSFRLEKERKIAQEFAPRPWNEISRQMATAIKLWADKTEEVTPRVPVAVLGAYHPIVRNFERRIWRGMRSAEIFRAGAGWWGPDNWGCWTKAGGGRLEIGLPSGSEDGVRLYIQLHGLPTRECAWTAIMSGTRPQKGVLAPGVFKWISFDVGTIPDDRVLRLTIEGSSIVDLRSVTDGLDPRIVSIGVTGFFLCAADDAPTRAAFLEAIMLGNLPDLAFNREPIDDALPIEDKAA